MAAAHFRTQLREEGGGEGVPGSKREGEREDGGERERGRHGPACVLFTPFSIASNRFARSPIPTNMRAETCC
eukprot:6212167-Pleurochrysis_carterae.AAC.5